MSSVPYFPQGISSRVMPHASMAEIKAIGNPVALEAKALERLVLGLISMMMMRSVLGSCANWQLQPPITWTLSTTFHACSCRRSCTSFEIVSIGAEHRESPVCTPIGSIFSIKQTVTI